MKKVWKLVSCFQALLKRRTATVSDSDIVTDTFTSPGSETNTNDIDEQENTDTHNKRSKTSINNVNDINFNEKTDEPIESVKDHDTRIGIDDSIHSTLYTIQISSRNMKIAQPAKDIKGDTIEAKVGLVSFTTRYNQSQSSNNNDRQQQRRRRAPTTKTLMVMFKNHNIPRKIFKEDIWSVERGQYNFRVLPPDWKSDEPIRRTSTSYRIQGLGPNTTARDLNDFVKHIKGKTCYIPTNPTTGRSLRYAIVYTYGTQKQGPSSRTL
ncbi:unnamed protein product [Rhizophagus irregularis]|nr:unnamed protein product [Rhizophagus irregularis]